MALGYLVLLWFVGRLHARRVYSRLAHPSMASRSEEADIQADEARPDEVGEDESEVTQAGDLTPPSVPRESPAPRRHSEIHAGLPELIHALGPEPPWEGEDRGQLAAASHDQAVPIRFERFFTESGRLELQPLIESVLNLAGYSIKPERGDLVATRGEERLLVRVLPWDGSFVTVGTRTIDRFASDFFDSSATDGICMTEAVMPEAAVRLESANPELWFVGRERLVRLLESLDAVLALASPPANKGAGGGAETE